MNQKHFLSRRRGGFMTIGLILCMILALTVAGVLWNYQYMTIQNLELECAARSAIQAAIDDPDLTTSISKVLETGTGNEVTDTKLNDVLELTVAQQNRGTGNTIEVHMYDSTNKILVFRQSRKLGIFRSVFNKDVRQKIENGSFTQYYQIIQSGVNYSFKKYYP